VFVYVVKCYILNALVLLSSVKPGISDHERRCGLTLTTSFDTNYSGRKRIGHVGSVLKVDYQLR